ncbi:MAG: hypothetical protein M0Z51_13390, partial [Propionibacterium sp.]|nr:hypothetical protein [Propionibacterium sp.]
VAARMASKRALTDPDDVAVIQQLLGVLAAIDDVVDARIDVTADYLGVESPDDDDMTPEAPSEDDMARANALAWAQARAHRSV